MIRAAIEEDDPPPPLAREFPRPDSALAGDWVEVPEYRLPQPADSQPATRIHKVTDGDTLALLAERYLGDAHRSEEILAFNRDVLGPSGVLPIGVELRIPPRSTPVPQAEDALPERPLVPIQPQ
jgi:nucleoid-associated protein YgaU